MMNLTNFTVSVDSPLISLYNHVNFTREDIENLIKYHSKHSYHTIKTSSSEADSDNGIYNAVFVSVGLLVLILISIIIKYKPEEMLKR